MSKADLLTAVQDAIIAAIKDGATIADFRKTADELFERHGYDRLHPWRIDTIFRTNMQTAFQGGRFRQMNAGAVIAARPFWRYVATLDGSTRQEHAALHGKVFKHDHSFWNIWYPPNGFN